MSHGEVALIGKELSVEALRWTEPRSGGSVNRCYTGAFFSPLESLVPGPVF